MYQFHGSLRKGRKQLAAKLMTRSSAKAAVKKIWLRSCGSAGQKKTCPLPVGNNKNKRGLELQAISRTRLPAEEKSLVPDFCD
jgi:hypothetical protein